MKRKPKRSVVYVVQYRAANGDIEIAGVYAFTPDAATIARALPNNADSEGWITAHDVIRTVEA